MIDIICNCCNGCSSKRQLSKYPRYGFSKKLLIAISVVVIIAMCVIPCEGRTLSDHRRRHKRPESMAQTKETLRTELHRRRHKRPESLTLPTKDTRQQNSADIYTSESKKIFRKIRNTKSYLKEDKKKLNELKEYKHRTPDWVPTINFVDIHYHDYKNSRFRKNGSSIPERKFTYLMPKLYKSLVEYEEVFKRLLHAELDTADNPSLPYKEKRKHIIRNTLNKLYSTIQEVNDSMVAVNLSVPPQNKNKPDLTALPTKFDLTACLRNDFLAFRGYFNLLNNWYLELRCPRNGKQAKRKICVQYEAKLRVRNKKKDNKIINL